MESRQSRMNKYYDNSEEIEATFLPSRTRKNQSLYKEVSNLELEDFDLNSNASVIGNNKDNISLDEIKNILEKRYHEKPRKKSFGDTDEIPLPKINLDETREYDINSILEKAKEKKEVNYEEDRLKKIRNTQYDILKSLDVINGEEEIEEKEDIKPDEIRTKKPNAKTEQELIDLIDTISAKELIKKEKDVEITGEMDPLDILSDLRGEDESTRVMGMLVKELEEAEKENNSTKDDEDTLEIDPAEDESDKKDLNDSQEITITKVDIDKDNKIDNSFVGKTTTFTQSDFDDFNDLKEDMHIAKIIIKLLIFIVVVLFIVGLVILLNKYLNLGLF